SILNYQSSCAASSRNMVVATTVTLSMLLEKAQMKHLAKLTEDAIAIAEKAWKLLLEKQDEDCDMDLFPFFSTLELNQPHHLRPLSFEHFILDGFILQFCIMYRVLHHVLAYDDLHYLDLTISALKKVDTEHDNSAE
ncbi:hypothetical protein ETB97_001207, partial [Aspergillus alliaceus]